MNFAKAQLVGAALNEAWARLSAKALAAGLTQEDLNPMCAALSDLHDAATSLYGQTVVPDAGTRKG